MGASQPLCCKQAFHHLPPLLRFTQRRCCFTACDDDTFSSFIFSALLLVHILALEFLFVAMLFSHMPATCFAMLLSCFPFYYCLTFLCVYHEYLRYFAVISVRYSICTLDKNHQHHFSHILHLQFQLCKRVCDCAENSIEKRCGNNSSGRARVKKRHTLLSAPTASSTVILPAQHTFYALFNAFFCHSKLITTSENTHCIEVLQEIFFHFFKARNLWS